VRIARADEISTREHSSPVFNLCILTQSPRRLFPQGEVCGGSSRGEFCGTARQRHKKLVLTNLQPESKSNIWIAGGGQCPCQTVYGGNNNFKVVAK
jgi:hypothetical protein